MTSYALGSEAINNLSLSLLQPRWKILAEARSPSVLNPRSSNSYPIPLSRRLAEDTLGGGR